MHLTYPSTRLRMLTFYLRPARKKGHFNVLSANSDSNWKVNSESTAKANAVVKGRGINRTLPIRHAYSADINSDRSYQAAHPGGPAAAGPSSHPQFSEVFSGNAIVGGTTSSTIFDFQDTEESPYSLYPEGLDLGDESIAGVPYLHQPLDAPFVEIDTRADETMVQDQAIHFNSGSQARDSPPENLTSTPSIQRQFNLVDLGNGFILKIVEDLDISQHHDIFSSEYYRSPSQEQLSHNRSANANDPAQQ